MITTARQLKDLIRNMSKKKSADAQILMRNYMMEDGFQVYTVKKDLHEIGIIAMQTSFGHSVPVYDMERTICDLLRSRKNIEMQVFQDALKQYAKRKDKNLRMLMKYAAMFHVENILRPYLEVLL